MENVYHVGLDVHKETIEVSIFRNWDQEPMYEKRLASDENNLSDLLRRYQKQGHVEACYEAGCMGYTLQRHLSEAGIACRVVASGKLPRRPSDKVKTDRRDAKNLAKMLRAGEAEGIYIPTREDEATRDFIRARDDVQLDLKRAKQRLLKFLLRNGYRYEEKKYWTKKHRVWIKGLHFDHVMQQETCELYYYRIEEIEDVLRRMDERIEGIGQSACYGRQVNKLRCLKGIEHLTALALVCEVGDFRRFSDATSFMAYLGLVPKEHSSGEKRRQGGITKSGNGHLRRLLVEASWHYRYQSPPSKVLRSRQSGQDAAVISYADRALKRLQKKFTKLVFKGKTKHTAVVAVARELAGFVWGLMTNNI